MGVGGAAAGRAAGVGALEAAPARAAGPTAGAAPAAGATAAAGPTPGPGAPLLGGDAAAAPEGPPPGRPPAAPAAAEAVPSPLPSPSRRPALPAAAAAPAPPAGLPARGSPPALPHGPRRAPLEPRQWIALLGGPCEGAVASAPGVVVVMVSGAGRPCSLLLRAASARKGEAHWAASLGGSAKQPALYCDNGVCLPGSGCVVWCLACTVPAGCEADEGRDGWRLRYS